MRAVMAKAESSIVCRRHVGPLETPMRALSGDSAADLGGGRTHVHSALNQNS